MAELPASLPQLMRVYGCPFLLSPIISARVSHDFLAHLAATLCRAGTGDFPFLQLPITPQEPSAVLFHAGTTDLLFPAALNYICRRVLLSHSMRGHQTFLNAFRWI